MQAYRGQLNTCTNTYCAFTGYFVAGGLAGMISRTATAPLDRLKVYLIAHIENKPAAMDAVKQASPTQAVKHLGRPLIEASKELWAAGGIRSLFAGMVPQNPLF